MANVSWGQNAAPWFINWMLWEWKSDDENKHAASQYSQKRVCHAVCEHSWTWLRTAVPPGMPMRGINGIWVLGLFEACVRPRSLMFTPALGQTDLRFLIVLLSWIVNFGQDQNERCFIISCKVLSDSTDGFMVSLMKDPWLCKNLSWLEVSCCWDGLGGFISSFKFKLPQNRFSRHFL